MQGITFLCSIFGAICLSVEHMVQVSTILLNEKLSAIKTFQRILTHHDYNFTQLVNDNVCRVDFDEAWWRPFDDDSFLDGPYPTIESVPESLSKNIVRQLGRALFIEPFAVFPVSYLDNEIIVFDFELLGTRICARKESK